MSSLWAMVHQKDFDFTVQARGKLYFRSGQVEMVFADENRATFKVQGNEPYEVELALVPEKKKLNYKCTCPHFLGGTPCKHIWAAILLADREGLFTPEDAADDGRTPSLGEHWKTRLEIAKGRRTQSSPNKKSFRREAVAKPKEFVAAFGLDLERSQSLRKIFVQLLVQEPKEVGLNSFRTAELSINSISQFPSEGDQKILSELLGHNETYGVYEYSSSEKRFGAVALNEERAEELLKEMSEAGKLYRMKKRDATPAPAGTFNRGTRADVEAYPYHPESLNFVLSLRMIDDSYYLTSSLRNSTQNKNLKDCLLALDHFVFFPDFVAPSDYSRHIMWRDFFGKNREVEIPQQEIEDFLNFFLHQPEMPQLELPAELRFQEISEQAPQVKLSVTNLSRSSMLGLSLEFMYGEHSVSAQDKNEWIYVLSEKQKIRRDREMENSVWAEMKSLFVTPSESKSLSEGVDFILSENKFLGSVESFLARQWQVYAYHKQVSLATQSVMNVEASGQDWFDLQVKFQFGDRWLSLPELLKIQREEGNLVRLADGTYGVLPAEWLRRYGPLAEMGKLEGDALRVSKVQALFLTAQLGEDERFSSDKKFRTLGDLLKDLRELAPAEPNEKFNGKLRPYQQKGLAWLDLLNNQSIGGILADDMGLGKTIQVLALLTGMKNPKSAKRPHLIVAPRSLIFNWIKEGETFAPHFKMLDYTGPNRQDFAKQLTKVDVILTTYQTLRMDIEKLGAMNFETFILDEAHAIKNPTSQVAQACRLIQARYKLALTGTPVENSLGDLFSILEVVNPGLITSSVRDRFLKEKDMGTLHGLGKALQVFILRRTKEEVLHDLPAKSEQILYCDLGPSERQKYDELKNHYWQRLSGAVAEKGLASSKIEVLEALLRLRQAACHQGLLNAKLKDQSSSKFELLVDQMSEVIKEGHKVLVFSQFTSLLDLLKARLELDGITYESLDGKTKNRQERVERFQTDKNVSVFLLSLKAGGVGLNLTAADYVFILDPWWNPAAEAQAIDRAHRIGQTQKVFAYKIIAKDTVEEKILELQKTKKALAKALVGGSEQGVLKGLQLEDLRMLLS